jgi:hypothetical protein
MVTSFPLNGSDSKYEINKVWGLSQNKKAMKGKDEEHRGIASNVQYWQVGGG